jgi:hypothetical protein
MQPHSSANRLRYVVSYDVLQKYGKRLEEAITLSRQKVCRAIPSSRFSLFQQADEDRAEDPAASVPTGTCVSWNEFQKMHKVSVA